MTVETAVAPWLDNYPIYRQLWSSIDHAPGTELKLVPTSRNLTVQWSTVAGVALVSSELQSVPFVRVADVQRGVIEIAVTGIGWNALRQDTTYTCEVFAYGTVLDRFSFRSSLPEPGEVAISGADVYASPRQLLETFGMIPGADVQTTVNLSGEWSLTPERYWSKVLPATQPLYGLWVNDVYAPMVEYADLALSGERAWAIVGTSDDSYTLYYKGPETLSRSFVETAYSRAVLRYLEQATAEVERRTQQFFNRRRVVREAYRGLSQQRQLSLRHYPVTVDRTFRLDCFAYAREVTRRYAETEVAGSQSANGTPVHVDGRTGLVTLNQSLWDYGDNFYSIGDAFGMFNTFPKGENNIEVSYTAGYDTPPIEISHATALLASIPLATFWQQQITQGMSGLSLGCANLNFGDLFSKWFPQWQQQATQILENYQTFDISAL